MKDSYSFDVDDEGLDASYQKHRDAYIRIFDRLGFEYVIVKATSGAMGGSKSEEFLAKAAVGEDTYVRCTHVRLRRQRRGRAGPSARARGVRRRPRRARGADARHPDHRRRWSTTSTRRSPATTGPGPPATRSRTCWWCSSTPTAPASPSPSACPATARSTRSGSRASSSPTEVEPFDETDFAKHPSLAKGYIGPGVLGEKNESGIRYLVDPRIVEGTRWVTGADVDGSHVIDLVAGRDFTADGTIEAAEVRDGDPCPNCDDGVLETARGIEMGHIFQLGRKYADALDLKVLDENGKLVTVTMGSYGIGPSRAVAAIAEGTLDEIGLAWPREVAPVDVHLVAAGKDEALFAAAERIAHELDRQGIEVLYDDRAGKISPGVKFKDAELIGVPTIVVVGKGLADGTIEVKDRASGTREEVHAEHVVDHVVRLVRA